MPRQFFFLYQRPCGFNYFIPQARFWHMITSGTLSSFALGKNWFCLLMRCIRKQCLPKKSSSTRVGRFWGTWVQSTTSFNWCPLIQLPKDFTASMYMKFESYWIKCFKNNRLYLNTWSLLKWSLSGKYKIIKLLSLFLIERIQSKRYFTLKKILTANSNSRGKQKISSILRRFDSK